MDAAASSQSGFSQQKLDADTEPPGNRKNGEAKKHIRPPNEKPTRPNYFLALQVSTSAAVTAAIKSVHSSLLQHSEGIRAALVEPETAHLTVMVTALQNKEDVVQAEAAMDSFAAHLAQDRAWTEPLSLTLQGLSHFRHQVLFLNINKDAEHDRLMAFVQAVRQHMQTEGINSTDDRDFVGHVTVAKMSKLMGKRRKGGSKLKKIAEEGYAEHVNIVGGTVLVAELQLCPMEGREPSAYYKIQKSVKICADPV